MEFQGFSPKTGEFLWDLAFNNERPWFNEHKAEYEQYLWLPFKALADEVLSEMRRRFPAIDFQSHVSRIYRDARRLYGRGPYKDHLWFTVKDSRIDYEGPSYWFELSAATYSYGMGFYGERAELMDALRRKIDANPAAFERLIAQTRSDCDFRLGGPEYKRPKADRGETINPWYNRRYINMEFGGDHDALLYSPELVKTVCDNYTALIPMHEYMLDVYLSVREKGDRL